MFKYEKLKNLMDERNVSAYKLSKATGISNSSFTDWKNERVKPSYEKIKSLADFFNVDINYFDCDYRPTEKKDTLSNLPENHFTNAEDAMKFIIKQPLIEFEGGYDLKKMTDEEIVEFTNDIIDLLKIAAKKYKKR